MCGISGLVTASGDEEDLAATVERMVASQRHRGPDGEGSRVESMPDSEVKVALGHNRLAVVDPTPRGAQPMDAGRDEVTIVYNGEVYNHDRIRSDLETKGTTFSTKTDTETVLEAYREHGLDVFDHLRGIFAFAILDRREERLVLARDPLGVKPLYYAEDEGTLAFASEIKAILAAKVVESEPDWEAIWNYFTYLYVPSPQTAFQGIQALRPGEYLVHDLDEGTTSTHTYWEPERDDEIAEATTDERRTELRERLETVVEDQLMSDVPLGVFLSGGVDSTIVSGLANRAEGPLKTCTVTFDDPDFDAFDEGPVARAVSEHQGSNHREIPVEDTYHWQMLDLLEHFDQPFGNPTFYLMYLVSRAAREDMTVALCGAGGDELFAGYPRYRALEYAPILDRIPQPLGALARSLLDKVPADPAHPTLRRARTLTEGFGVGEAERFCRWTYFLSEEEKTDLLGEASHSPSHEILDHHLSSSPFPSRLNRHLHADVETFLADNILEYTDKMSMAVGLEVRVPLLDPEIVDFGLNVPPEDKIDGSETKKLLRDSFPELFPPKARDHPKRGFNAPLARWMRGWMGEYFEAARDPSHELRDKLGDDIGATWREGPLDADTVYAMLEDHRQQRRDRGHELFAVLAFDVWWRKYIAQTASIDRWTPDPEAKPDATTTTPPLGA